jgi:hypothetical protein
MYYVNSHKQTIEQRFNTQGADNKRFILYLKYILKNILNQVLYLAVNQANIPIPVNLRFNSNLPTLCQLIFV